MQRKALDEPRCDSSIHCDTILYCISVSGLHVGSVRSEFIGGFIISMTFTWLFPQSSSVGTLARHTQTHILYLQTRILPWSWPQGKWCRTCDFQSKGWAIITFIHFADRWCRILTMYRHTRERCHVWLHAGFRTAPLTCCSLHDNTFPCFRTYFCSYILK